MKINVIAANMTELHLNNGTIILFSYNTPVAIFQPKVGYSRTKETYSSTTSRHINKWVTGYAEKVSQAKINALLD